MLYNKVLTDSIGQDLKSRDTFFHPAQALQGEPYPMNINPKGGKKRVNLSTQKLVRVIFGHGNKGGKTYDYLAPKSTRVGQMVTPPVNHPVSGKLYRTLAKVISTQDSSGISAQNIAGSLAGKGVMLKQIGQTKQANLPGYYTGWGRDAEARDEELYRARASGNLYDYNLTKQASQIVMAERKAKYDARVALRNLSKQGA